MTLYDKIAALDGIRHQSANAVRVISELRFAAQLSTAKGHIHDELIDKVAQYIFDCRDRDGVITNATCNEAEAMLMPLSAEAKAYTVHCISHAHIDMNWMWGYQETVSVTVDTFRTVLNLMKEYPTLTFAQSQASTYEIIEKYATSMVDDLLASKTAAGETVTEDDMNAFFLVYAVDELEKAKQEGKEIDPEYEDYINNMK